MVLARSFQSSVRDSDMAEYQSSVVNSRRSLTSATWLMLEPVCRRQEEVGGERYVVELNSVDVGAGAGDR